MSNRPRSTFTLSIERQRKADMRRQRELEAAEREERPPRALMRGQGDEHEELADEAPPGWGRS